ncbi:hypothetical protein HCN44_001658 [Aphidius gifuensis]|uniref:RHD domain-containing protein n=1 Tax=Aphidius gifuensis TaxID=684658 RepID=A0A834XTR5_APHGI|nr:nuclear factor NF-kappa-B p105 subunit [Aphidius gifuensis]KAF7992333.1 hypothetical protein HCN44_001658 [Aphidius gifuensis]
MSLLNINDNDFISDQFSYEGNNILDFFDENMVLNNQPELKIIDQPVDKYRFRYMSEWVGTHGSLGSTNTRKKQGPTVKLENYSGQSAIIRCTLSTTDNNRRDVHAHRLVTKEGNSEDDEPYDIEVNENNNWTASFDGIGIIHTAKKNIKTELIKKMQRNSLDKLRYQKKKIDVKLSQLEESNIKMNAEKIQKWIDLNSAALCFRAYKLDDNKILHPITDPVYSDAIKNTKSALTGELKICRIDKVTGSCLGGEDVFLLVEKVSKKHIKVKFFEIDDDDEETWCDYGKFTELDVHHQYAIVFRTPAYKDRQLTEEKVVFIQLERTTDGDSSEPVKFTYQPTDSLRLRKRPRISTTDTTMFTSGELSPEKNNLSHEEVILTDPKTIPNFDAVFFDEYFQVLQEDESTSSLCTDSKTCQSPTPSSDDDDDDEFAPSILRKVINEIKKNPKDTKEVMKYLKERTHLGDTFLHSALRYNQDKVLKCFLNIIASRRDLKYLVNMKNDKGQTPLHYAVILNQPAIVDELLTLGANPDLCDNNKLSVIHESVKDDDTLECLNMLIKAQANTEYEDVTGKTALHLAAESGSIGALDILVRANADVNKIEKICGRTALYIAVERGHAKIVEYLLEKTNINIDQESYYGNTAVDAALARSPGAKTNEIISLLEKHGANINVNNNNDDTDSDSDDHED